MVKIVWNGCDGYVEADEAVRLGYDFDGERLYHGAHAFPVFEAVEVDISSVPLDDDGEPIVDGLFGGEGGKVYRAV